jgi:hypothetical protein
MRAAKNVDGISPKEPCVIQGEGQRRPVNGVVAKQYKTSAVREKRILLNPRHSAAVADVALVTSDSQFQDHPARAH